MDVTDMRLDGQEVSRKSYIRDVLTDFVMRYPGYSYSVVVFADEARTLIPATTDPNILSTFLRSLEAFNSLPGGSNFQAALDYTSAYLDRIQTPAYVVLLSDGGDEFVDLDRTTFSADYMAEVLVFGVGSEDGGYVPNGVDLLGRTVVKKFQ